MSGPGDGSALDAVADGLRELASARLDDAAFTTFCREMTTVRGFFGEARDILTDGRLAPSRHRSLALAHLAQAESWALLAFADRIGRVPAPVLAVAPAPQADPCPRCGSSWWPCLCGTGAVTEEVTEEAKPDERDGDPLEKGELRP